MIFSLLYRILWIIAPPFIRHYLRRRSQKQANYALNWHERFGQTYPHAKQGVIWIHAVSVGETRAAAPLLEKLKLAFPNTPVLITQMTPTGRETAQLLYPDAQCRYLPYDHPKWVRRFLREHRPLFGVLMETEIWPNLIKACHQQSIPLFLANARLSQQSQCSYMKVHQLIAPVMAQLTACYAQSQDDALRLEKIGAKQIQVMGNTKYDITPPPSSFKLAQELKQKIGQRTVWVVASTRQHHETDEAILILETLQHRLPPHVLLIIVPRHPERFTAVAEAATQLGFQTQKRSDGQTVHPHTQVWIGDSMGELFAYYHLADFVFVGGSLVHTGCQNIIEPLSCGKPVLFGPSTYNFQTTCEYALKEGVAKQVHSAEELIQTALTWANDLNQCRPFAERAIQFVQKHQGASQKITDDIVQKIQQN